MVSGLLCENATRGYGWRFLDIGRRLERARQTSDLILAAMVQGPFDLEPAATTLLQIADSSITYRSRYFTEFKTENVLETLVTDETNPRAIGFQLVTLVNQLYLLPNYESDSLGDNKTSEVPAALVLARKLLTSIRSVALEDLAARDAEGNLATLEGVLRLLQGNLYDLSELLTAQYFSHVILPRLTTAP